MTEYECHDCSHVWDRERVTGLFVECPECDTTNATGPASWRAQGVPQDATGPAKTVPTNGRLGPDDFAGGTTDDFPSTDDFEREDDGATQPRPDLADSRIVFGTPESDKPSDDCEAGMATECGLDGCAKEAIVDILDTDDALGDNGNRCGECLLYYLRENVWESRWD